MLGKHQNIAMCYRFDLLKSALFCICPPAAGRLYHCTYLLELQEVGIICELFFL